MLKRSILAGLLLLGLPGCGERLERPRVFDFPPHSITTKKVKGRAIQPRLCGFDYEGILEEPSVNRKVSGSKCFTRFSIYEKDYSSTKSKDREVDLIYTGDKDIVHWRKFELDYIPLDNRFVKDQFWFRKQLGLDEMFNLKIKGNLEQADGIVYKLRRVYSYE